MALEGTLRPFGAKFSSSFDRSSQPRHGRPDWVCGYKWSWSSSRCWHQYDCSLWVKYKDCDHFVQFIRIFRFQFHLKYVLPLELFTQNYCWTHKSNAKWRRNLRRMCIGSIMAFPCSPTIASVVRIMRSHWMKWSASTTQTQNTFSSFEMWERTISACTIAVRKMHSELTAARLNWRDDQCRPSSRNHHSLRRLWPTISSGKPKVYRQSSSINWNFDKFHRAILRHWIETIQSFGTN